MRILIASGNRSLQGGAEHHLCSLLPALRARGHQLALLHEMPGGAADSTIDQGCQAIPCWGTSELGTAAVLERAAAWRPDLVYVHGLADPCLEDTLTRDYPSALCAHNYYGTCGTGTKCHAWPRVRPCSRTLSPACLLLHYPRRCGGLNPLSAWREYRRQRRRSALLERYRAILVATRHMHSEYLRQGVGEKRLHVVPHFPAGMVPDPEPPLFRSGTGQVLMTGRLTNLKGGDFLIQALPEASRLLGTRLRLVVTGAGPARAPWQARANRLGLDVDFAGHVGPQQLEDLRRQADLVAVPSLWPEPFGLVGIEAGCVGLPAVGFATGGIPDWLIPGETGESAPGDPPTVDGLAQAVVRALRDPEHHQRLRVGAWCMAQRFTLSRHLEVLEPILELAARG